MTEQERLHPDEDRLMNDPDYLREWFKAEMEAAKRHFYAELEKARRKGGK